MSMIAGNPNAGRKLATLAIAIVVMMFLITGILAMRKKTAPVKEPPLHPSVAVLKSWLS